MNSKIELTPAKILAIVALVLGVIWGWNIIEAWFGIMKYKSQWFGGFGSSTVNGLMLKLTFYSFVDLAVLAVSSYLLLNEEYQNRVKTGIKSLGSFTRDVTRFTIDTYSVKKSTETQKDNK